MSHPDSCYDPDNSYEDDMNYDDYNDFYGEVNAEDLENSWDDSFDDSMDGDFDSAMRDAGFGTDEDYGGGFRDDIDAYNDYYGGE